MGRQVFVSGLSEQTSLEDFEDFFSSYGKVEKAILKVFYKTRKERIGYGFVTFDSERAANTVCEIRFHEIDGMITECKKTQLREDMPSEECQDSLQYTSQQMRDIRQEHVRDIKTISVFVPKRCRRLLKTNSYPKIMTFPDTLEAYCEERKVFVTGLGATTEKEIKEYFESSYGRVKDVIIKTDHECSANKFAFVTFESVEVANKVREIEHHKIDEENLICRSAWLDGEERSEIPVEQIARHLSDTSPSSYVDSSKDKSENEPAMFRFSAIEDTEHGPSTSSEEVSENQGTHPYNWTNDASTKMPSEECESLQYTSQQLRDIRHQNVENIKEIPVVVPRRYRRLPKSENDAKKMKIPDTSKQKKLPTIEKSKNMEEAVSNRTEADSAQSQVDRWLIHLNVTSSSCVDSSKDKPENEKGIFRFSAIDDTEQGAATSSQKAPSVRNERPSDSYSAGQPVDESAYLPTRSFPFSSNKSRRRKSTVRPSLSKPRNDSNINGDTPLTQMSATVRRLGSKTIIEKALVVGASRNSAETTLSNEKRTEHQNTRFSSMNSTPASSSVSSASAAKEESRDITMDRKADVENAMSHSDRTRVPRSQVYISFSDSESEDGVSSSEDVCVRDCVCRVGYVRPVAAKRASIVSSHRESSNRSFGEDSKSNVTQSSRGTKTEYSQEELVRSNVKFM